MKTNKKIILLALLALLPMTNILKAPLTEDEVRVIVANAAQAAAQAATNAQLQSFNMAKVAAQSAANQAEHAAGKMDAKVLEMNGAAGRAHQKIQEAAVAISADLAQKFSDAQGKSSKDMADAFLKAQAEAAKQISDAFAQAQIDGAKEMADALGKALSDAEKDKAKLQEDAIRDAIAGGFADLNDPYVDADLPDAYKDRKGEGLSASQIAGEQWAKGAFKGLQSAGGDSFKAENIMNRIGAGTKAVVKDFGAFCTSERLPKFIAANRMPILWTVAGVGTISVLVYGAKKGIKLGVDRARYLWRNPTLIEDTDVTPVLRPWVKPKFVGTLDEVQGQPEFKSKLHGWVRQLKESRGTGRGSCAMLFGQPGTGKTFCSKRVARAAGMRYVIIKGGVIADCENPIAELDKIIKWAKRLGILLIIDEADALICRGIDAGDSKAHRILNHFISVTGDPFDRPNMVLITNKPEVIDPRFTADGGRVDTAIMFPELDMKGIANILRDNIDKWARMKKVVVQVDFDRAARGTPGKCPGRDLEALSCKAVLAAAFEGKALTTEGLDAAAKDFQGTKRAMREFTMGPAGHRPVGAAAAA